MFENAFAFIVAERGRDADPFMLHLYAALAEKERRLTRSALGRLWPPRKPNSARLGNPMNIVAAGSLGRSVQTATADEFVTSLCP